MPESNRGVLTIEENIKARALSLGFLSCGITTPEPLASHSRFIQWLEKGNHTAMHYLATPYHRDTRRDPKLLIEDVKSIVVLAYQYPIHPKSALLEQHKALVAGYAAGIDYHYQLPALMDELISYIRLMTGNDLHATRYTDSAPILERELGQRAGLGWIGKNSCLISPTQGSTFLLAEIFLNLTLKPDLPFEKDFCGKCHRCIDACPTACINQDRTINCSACISYHTIENKKAIPPDIAQVSGNWLFGCDVCQMVCPWNRHNYALLSTGQALAISTSELAELIFLTQDEFHDRFANTPILRSKWKGFIRNALIVLSSTKPELAMPVVLKFKDIVADEDLRTLSDWCIERLKKNPPK